MNQEYSDEHQNRIIFGAVILMLAIVLFINWATGPKEHTKSIQEQPDVVGTQIINYEKLREWHPHKDKSALGLEILVDESDVSTVNLKTLVRKLSTDYDTAVIKLYQDKSAWLAERNSRTYTDAQRKGYLAYFIKNNNGSEVRWMQSIGTLEALDGTSEQL